MLVVLDKDGTLVKPKSGGEFVKSPEDQELIPGVKERIQELVKMGATLAIASNQGGVTAGHKTLEGAIAEMRYCMDLLPEIKACVFCPDFAGSQCYEVWLHGVFEAGFNSDEIEGEWQKFKNEFRGDEYEPGNSRI